MSDDLNELRRKLDFALFERDEARETAKMLTRNAVLSEERWNQTFEKRAAREHEMIGEAIDDFCDAVLGKLKELGVPETDNCDGDDDVETIFASWIHARMIDARDEGSLAGRAAGDGGVDENATPKEATDNAKSSDSFEGRA